MFLYELKNKEKECMFNLIKMMMGLDSRSADAEVNHLDECCREMEIDIFEVEPMSLEECYLVLRNSSYKTKKIALLELLYAGYADGYFGKDENEFIYDFVDNIGLTGKDVVNQKENVSQYVKLMKEIVDELNY